MAGFATHMVKPVLLYYSRYRSKRLVAHSPRPDEALAEAGSQLSSPLFRTQALHGVGQCGLDGLDAYREQCNYN